MRAPARTIFKKMRRSLVILSVLALFVLPATASAANWPTGKKRPDVATLVKPGLAAWVQPCSGGSQIMVRSLANGLGAPKAITRCAAFEMTKPSLAYTSFGNRTMVVWSQAPQNRSSAARGIFVSVSTTSGAKWSKPRLLLATNTAVPPPVRAGAYVYKLWVMWSAPTSRKQTPIAFNIRPWDVRYWTKGPLVAGIGNFRVFPSTNSMQLYATKDGLAAFWQTSGTDGSAWHFADTERVNPYDLSKRVRFLYRGKIGFDGNVNTFLGVNGVLYRLVRESVRLEAGTAESVYKLYRWKFIGHRFAPAYASAEVLRLPQAQLGMPSQVAAMVDAGGNLNFVYSELEGFPSCFLKICAVAAPGQPFRSYLRALRVDRISGAKTVRPLALPFLTNPLKENAALTVWNYTSRTANTLVVGQGGLRLFASSSLAPVTERLDRNDFFVTPASPGFQHIFYLSAPLG